MNTPAYFLILSPIASPSSLTLPMPPFSNTQPVYLTSTESPLATVWGRDGHDPLTAATGLAEPHLSTAHHQVLADEGGGGGRGGSSLGDCHLLGYLDGILLTGKVEGPGLSLVIVEAGIVVGLHLDTWGQRPTQLKAWGSVLARVWTSLTVNLKELSM